MIIKVNECGGDQQTEKNPDHRHQLRVITKANPRRKKKQGRQQLDIPVAKRYNCGAFIAFAAQQEPTYQRYIMIERDPVIA
jgi:hypothetical protein